MSKRRYIQNLRSQTTIDNNGVKIPTLPYANYIKEQLINSFNMDVSS